MKQICGIEDYNGVICQRPIYARNMCQLHINRTYREADLRKPIQILRKKSMTDSELIEWISSQTKLGGPKGTCMIWKRHKKKSGHAEMGYKYKKQLVARIVYQILNAIDLEEGDCVLHRCDQNDCVNIDHLYLGTYQDNHHDTMRDTNKNLKYQLTLEDVEQIRNSNEKIIDLASDYGVSNSTISAIRNNKTWHPKNIEGALQRGI